MLPDADPVLVTGAAGFIGSHLCQRLISLGHRVVGVDNLCPFYDPQLKRANLRLLSDAAPDRFKCVEIDLRERDRLADALAQHEPAAVVHLAAMAGVRPSIERPAHYMDVNVTGSVNLLDAAVAVGVRKFLFASSSSVYDKVPFAETDPVDDPISPYAASKKAGELICHTYSHLHNLPIFCLRFFTVFGPRQRPDLAISKFLRLVRDGQPITMFGDGSSSRDYTFIDDIVDGILAALERCDRYRVYNLGGNQPISLRDMIATIEQVTGQKAIIHQKPMQPGDVDRTYADLSRSQQELGYQPQTAFADGVARQWQAIIAATA